MCTLLSFFYFYLSCIDLTCVRFFCEHAQQDLSQVYAVVTSSSIWSSDLVKSTVQFVDSVKMALDSLQRSALLVVFLASFHYLCSCETVCSSATAVGNRTGCIPIDEVNVCRPRDAEEVCLWFQLHMFVVKFCTT